MKAEIITRSPTAEQFANLVAAVGFKPHSLEAIRIGFANTWYSVCAVHEDRVIGVGRVVGDGALHFYVTGVMVLPLHQRQGVGSAIVEALLAKIKEVPYTNVLVQALPLPGLEAFYGRFGFRASRRPAPGMHLWLNDVTDNTEENA